MQTSILITEMNKSDRKAHLRGSSFSLLLLLTYFILTRNAKRGKKNKDDYDFHKIGLTNHKSLKTKQQKRFIIDNKIQAVRFY